VIAHGTDRSSALDALDSALARTVVLGLAHNVGVLRQLVADRHVRAATMTTSLIGDLALGAAPPSFDEHRTIAAALLLAARREQSEPSSPWTSAPGWRVGDRAPVRTTLLDEDGAEVLVAVLGGTDACTVRVGDGDPREASLLPGHDGPYVHVTVDGVARRYAAAVDASGRELVSWIGLDGDAWAFRVPVRHRIRRPDDADEEGGELRSPMPGAVVVIAVVEAMKMEYPLVSPFAGVVGSVAVTVGAQVVRDQVVATVHPEETA
jgi:acetyl-CoA/propionyl-CoA carboxylase biotin carboxyl carrier protein